MDTFEQGGWIKHLDYYQCGKGQDLGFGMGEQMLSWEYYYLGMQLPIDWLLTFYHGHSRFHINNILVIYSIQVFMVTC